MTPSILIASFTDISRDPRAMKQVRAALEVGAVTTCSFGPSPHPDVDHIELNPEAPFPGGKFKGMLNELARKAEFFPWIFNNIPYVTQAREALRGRNFDAAIANNGDAARLVRRLVKPGTLHVDLHEYFPGLVFDDGSTEAHRQQRYFNWLHDTAVSGVSSTTVVSPGIAQRYLNRGINPEVITNAGYSQDLPVRPTDRPIRYVHSGNSQSGRGLRRMMHAVASAESEVTLDLFLVPNDLVVHEEIVTLARQLGDRIRVQAPVPQSDLVSTLNRYDVGIFVAPPSIPNTELALPNKFFDFVQARLGILVSPLPEMEHLVNLHGLGRVTRGFEISDIVDAINSFTISEVDDAKLAAGSVAVELSGDTHNEHWKRILNKITSSPKRGDA